MEETIAAVEAVLREIDADRIPRELVLNKIDTVDPLARRRLANRYPGAVQLSAQTGEGLDALRARVAERLAGRFVPVRLLVPYADGRVLTELYGLGTPIEERADLPEGVRIVARLPRSEVGRFAQYLVAEREALADHGA